MSLLFFYKQKTAYEMRISDWSSDVCSSDLCSARLVSSSSFVIDQDRPDPCRGAAPDRDPFHVPDPSRPYRPRAASFPDARDRKSDGSGKCVSVRLDLGCRRHIKKITDCNHEVTT